MHACDLRHLHVHYCSVWASLFILSSAARWEKYEHTHFTEGKLRHSRTKGLSYLHTRSLLQSRELDPGYLSSRLVLQNCPMPPLTYSLSLAIQVSHMDHGIRVEYWQRSAIAVEELELQFFNTGVVGKLSLGLAPC